MTATTNDAERSAVAEALASVADAMAIDELQGFCVAIAMADSAPPDGWQAVVLGREEPPPDELAERLERFRLATADALERGTLVIDARTTRAGRVDHGPWCRAFLDGVEASAWFDLADPEELGELLFAIDVLADALPERDRAAYKPAQWRELVHASAEGLGDAVQRLHDYWRIVRTPPSTIRRDVPKVGRNDPCPCGSGRKFKQCHGRG